MKPIDPNPRGFVYELPLPIDNWLGFIPSDQLMNVSEPFYGWPGETERISELIRHAKREIVQRSRWEGDIRGVPYIGGLPPSGGDCCTLVMIGLKQENNGETFIWSPVELLWLREYEGPRTWF